MSILRVLGQGLAKQAMHIAHVDIEFSPVQQVNNGLSEAAIEKLLTHLNKKAAGAKPARLPESPALPQAVLFDGP